MKLHLPKKLTAALLAACTAFALNTTAAAATTGTATFTGGTTYIKDAEIVDGLYLTSQMTTGTTDTSKLPSGLPNITGGDFFAGNYTVSIWVSAATLNSGNSVLFKYDDKGGNKPDSNAIVWTKTGEGTGTLTIGRGKGDFTSYSWSNSSTTGAITLGDDAMVNFTFAVTGANQSQTATVYVNGTKHDDLAAYAGNMNGGGAGSTMKYYVSTAATYGNVSITNEKLTTQTGIYALMGVTSVAPGTEEKHFVWKGSTDGKWDTETTNWVTTTAPENPTTFESGDANTVTFGTEPSQKEVELSTTASVASVTVNDSYTLSIANGGSLTTDALNITTGETTIAGEGSLTTGHLALSDNSSLKLIGTGAVSLSSMTFGSGSALKVARTLDLGTLALTSSDTPAIQVQNGGELTISAASTIGGASLNSENSTAFTNLFQGKAVDVQGTGKLVIDGGISTVDRNQGNQAYASGLSNLEILGNAKINTWAATNTTYNLGNHSIKTTGDLWLVTKQTLNISEGGNLEVGGKLKLGHDGNTTSGPNSSHLVTTDATISLGGIGMYGGNNSVSITGGDLTFNTASATDNVLSKAGGGDLASDPVTFTGVTLHSGTHGWTLAPVQEAAVNLAGVTTLDVDADKPITLTAGIDGTITKIGAGTATVNGTGSLSDTIKVNVGKLVLTGSYEIGGITPTGGETTYSGGENENNGYETARGQIVAYTGNIEDHASYTYHGGSVTLTEGAYSLPGEMDPTIFYINRLSESYSWIDEKKTEDFSGIVVKSGAALVVDKNMNMSMVSTDSRGTVEIDSGYVATSDGTVKNVALAGDGTYALGDDNITMTATLGDDWSGAVRLGGFAFNDAHTHSLTPFWKGSSVVEMCGITGGYLAGWNQGTESANIRLTNPGDDGIAWVWSDGTSGTSDPTITFTGTWEGEGTFKLSNLRQNITFAGDISGWGGTFDYHGNHGTILTFAEDADEINATILNNGVNNTTDTQKQFHLIVQNEAEFGKDVAAYTLEVAEGASATFQGDATFNSLSGTGKVALDEGAKLTVSGTVADTVTIDAADGAVIDAKLAPTQVGIAANATATFEQGISDASGVTFSKEGGVDVKNTNAGGPAINYSINEENAKVTAEWLSFDGSEDTSIANQVDVDAIVNMSGHKLTLENAASMELSSVTLVGEDSVLALNYKDEQQAVQEGTVTITEFLVAGGGTLLANLTLAGTDGRVVLDLSTAQQGMSALTLGSKFGIAEGTLVTLDDETIAALERLQVGGTLDIIRALSPEVQLTYLNPDYNGMWFGQLFERTDEVHGDYRVYATGESFGLTKVSMVPEPTTGTLSLLALMALAARRRRH